MATPASMLTTAPQPKAWLPDDIGSLVIQPVQASSVAIQAAGSVSAAAHTDAYRAPIVAEDPTAAWVAEGEEIPASTATLGEVADTFHKLAGLTVISRELAEDSSPDVAQQVGQGLGRDIARKLDSAFFGARGDNALQPLGLGDLKDANTIAAGTTIKNLDPFLAAIAAAENVGATLNAFVANPADALALAQLKDQTGSQRPLLGPDPTEATRRVLSGVPLLTSPAVAAGTVWGIPSGRVIVAIREDVLLARDESVYFTSDRIALRATMRVTFLHPHEKAIQKITAGA